MHKFVSLRDVLTYATSGVVEVTDSLIEASRRASLLFTSADYVIDSLAVFTNVRGMVDALVELAEETENSWRMSDYMLLSQLIANKHDIPVDKARALFDVGSGPDHLRAHLGLFGMVQSTPLGSAVSISILSTLLCKSYVMLFRGIAGLMTLFDNDSDAAQQYIVRAQKVVEGTGLNAMLEATRDPQFLPSGSTVACVQFALEGLTCCMNVACDASVCKQVRVVMLEVREQLKLRHLTEECNLSLAAFQNGLMDEDVLNEVFTAAAMQALADFVSNEMYVMFELHDGYVWPQRKCISFCNNLFYYNCQFVGPKRKFSICILVESMQEAHTVDLAVGKLLNMLQACETDASMEEIRCSQARVDNFGVDQAIEL